MASAARKRKAPQVQTYTRDDLDSRGIIYECYVASLRMAVVQGVVDGEEDEWDEDGLQLPDMEPFVGIGDFGSLPDVGIAQDAEEVEEDELKEMAKRSQASDYPTG
ncbi:hypothetical protein MPER_12982 [Moniliophthora perniciosa FA553]|nr:hypothetical protein MPER_12982 [Moniliophthora perniciosa FA553]